MTTIVLIGAGNVASHLAPALQKNGYKIIQIYSRTKKSAQLLGEKLKIDYTEKIQAIKQQAQIYLFAVSDKAIEPVLQKMPQNKQALYLHTGGSMPMNIFKQYVTHFGVLYPLQTFSKNRKVNLTQVPFFVEANKPENLVVIKKIAEKLSNICIELSSDDRKYLHLAAVFACNFVNHLYHISQQVLSEKKIDFSVLHPLIQETAQKALENNPADVQTGPAVRYDTNIIEKQLDLLKNTPQYAQIYEQISKSIHFIQKKKE